MEELSFFFGVLGNISAFLILLSPIGTFWRIVKNRSTGEFSSFPYICMVLNASLWTYYGFIKPNSLLIATVNGSGIIISTVYLSLFLLLAPPKLRASTAALAAAMNLGIAAAVISVAEWGLEGETSINFTGFFCACFNILRYASPLSIMKKVVTTKSVEWMPFSLSFFLFLNGLMWVIYAILVGDIFLGVPHSMGFVLGASQLGLYGMYKNAKPSSIDVLEEGLLVPSYD